MTYLSAESYEASQKRWYAFFFPRTRTRVCIVTDRARRPDERSVEGERKYACTHKRARLRRPRLLRGLPAITRGGNKREGLPRRVWRCLRLINVNLIQCECRCIHEAGAFVRQSHARLLSRRMTSASLACGCTRHRGSCACLETQAAFSVYQVMGKFNCRIVYAFFLESTFARQYYERESENVSEKKIN